MKEKLVINLEGLKTPDYVGSVQRLYNIEDYPDLIVSETTPGGSVFDVGTIFEIPLSDICRVSLRQKIFTLLSSADAWQKVLKSVTESSLDYSVLSSALVNKFTKVGARTHHIGMVDGESGLVVEDAFPSNLSKFVVIKKFQVIKPKRIYCNSVPLWDYSQFYHSDKFIIPLENIVRFGMTPGSSVYKKFLSLHDDNKKAYLKELGLIENLKPWMKFSTPIVDFTTKYEPEDRNLDLQESLYISGCNSDIFLDIRRMSILGSIMVSQFFAELGLYLWDIKWEIAKENEELVFVDTIDTDSVRVTMQTKFEEETYHVHFNKQAMRDYYKIIHPKWFSSLNSAKELAKQSGKPFHEHLKEGQDNGDYPMTPVVDSDFIEIQKEKFSTLLDYIKGLCDCNKAKESLGIIAKREIDFYKKYSNFKLFCEFNKL